MATIVATVEARGGIVATAVAGATQAGGRRVVAGGAAAEVVCLDAVPGPAAGAAAVEVAEVPEHALRQVNTDRLMGNLHPVYI